MVPILNGEKAAPAVMRAIASPSTEATAAHNFLTASPSNADDAPFLTAPVAASSSGSSPSTSIASTGGGSLISTLPAQSSDWPQEGQTVTNDLGNLGLAASAAELGQRCSLLSAQDKRRWDEEAAKDKENAAHRAKQEPQKLGADKSIVIKELVNKGEEGTRWKVFEIKRKPSRQAGNMKARSRTDPDALNSQGKSIPSASGDPRSGDTGESCTVIQGVSTSNNSGDVSPAVAKYFAFLFSRWTSTRQKHPDVSPREVQEKLWQQWNSSHSVPPAISASSSKQSKRAGSVKDPLEPKKPPTVFFLFFLSAKDEVMESKPEMSYKEVVAELGRVWNGFTDKEKSPFLAQHKQLMDQWYEDREAYRMQRDESLGRKRKVKDPLQPKKPPSVFFLFFHSIKDEVMASRPEMTYRELEAELGRVWKELGEEEKAPFKAQHQQMMTEWRKASEERRVRIPNKLEKKEREEVEVEEKAEEENMDLGEPSGEQKSPFKVKHQQMMTDWGKAYDRQSENVE